MRFLAVCVLALVLALALAGCAKNEGSGPPAASSSSSSSGQAMTMTSAAPTPTTGSAGSAQAIGPRLTLTDCQNFGAVFPVPMESARTALPAGFEPVASPSDPAGGATLYVLGVRCAASSVDGNDTGAATLAYAELAVVPPADKAVAGLTDATVPLVFAATPPAVGEALAAFRLGQAGPGDVAWVEHSGAGDVIVAATLGDASFTLRGALAPTPPAGLGSGDFALYGVQAGEVVTTLRGSSQGGEAVDAAVTLESAGLPLLGEARPAARGFSVSGFSLAFSLA